MAKTISDEQYTELYHIVLDLATVFDSTQFIQERKTLADMLVKKHQLLSSSSPDFWKPTEALGGETFHAVSEYLTLLENAGQTIGKFWGLLDGQPFVRDLLLHVAAATLVMLEEYDEPRD